MKSKKDIIENVKKFVESKLNDEITGHDYWHAIRVFKLARAINKKEGGDEFIISVAALIHDLADRKIDDKLSFEQLEDILKQFDIDKEIAKKIIYIVKYVSFSSKQPRMKTLELKIVQDADKLDALGAIGIARTFAYGGKDNRKIYDPAVRPRKRMSKKKYKEQKGHSINHLYEKLLKLKFLMNTKTGRGIAEKRHKFLENYLKQFHKEWNVKI